MFENLMGRDMNGELFASEPVDKFAFEKRVLRRGYSVIAGVDEAGRGALAGPVVAAAVILSPDADFSRVDDSKKLSPAARDELFDMIMKHALAVGVGSGDHGLIDRVNILQATLRAMKEAVDALSVKPDYLLVDGISAPPVALPVMTIKKGDGASASIAAASIIAKVTRDRLMTDFGRQFPAYGFELHKGYGSPVHLRAIAEHGPCPIHRTTFRGVKEFLGAAP